MKILLELTYDGTDFCGWQVQRNAPTVQAHIQRACERLFGFAPSVTGCSRTDSGVHALKYFCTVAGDIKLPCEKIPRALNSLLPSGIAVRNARVTDDAFHPRYSSLGKEYSYLVNVSPCREPLLEGRAWQLCRPLDTDEMTEAAKILVGRHAFGAFCSSGSSVTDTVRQIKYLTVSSRARCVQIKVAADGFLYNMVRIIAGTLCEVGLNKRSLEEVRQALITGERKFAGRTAPACGLYLTDVFYDFTE